MSALNTALPTGRWSVDLTRTTATFTVRNGPRTVHGTVPVTSGTVTSGTTPSTVEATLDLSEIDTGNHRRDRDLRKPRLLDLDRHPTMRFTASRITSADDGPVVVTGVLTARGRDVPLTLRVTHEPVGPATDRTVSAQAHATLDRRDLGIVAPPFMIGHRVGITIDAVLVPQA